VRPLEELLSDEPAWPLIQSWLAEATNDVEVLPAERAQGEDVLHRLQVTSHSTLGAVALETGGILVDRGWLRLLGSGSPRLQATLASWNKIGDAPEIEPLEWALVVGFDAVGGFFAFNGGDLPGARGDICYFAPDTLAWEPLELGYTAFVEWTCTADLEGFYAELRWRGWQEELAGASADQGFHFWPMLFLNDGGALVDRSRRLIPMRELWGLQQELAPKIAALPDGATVRWDLGD
jgi:hypothetical protein